MNGPSIFYQGVTRFEWACQRCGSSGAGLMPEEHASGACEVTRTTVLPLGYVDGGGI